MFEDPQRWPRDEETEPESIGIAEDSPQGGGTGEIGGQGGEGQGAENLSTAARSTAAGIRARARPR